MRLLSVLGGFPPMFAGPAKLWIRLARHFSALGVEVDVMARQSRDKVVLGRLNANGSLEGVEARVTDGKYLRRLWVVGCLLYRARRKYDAMIFNGPNEDALYLGVIMKALLGVPIIYRMTLYGEDDPEAIRVSGRAGRFRLAIVRCADAVVSLNPAMTNSAIRAGIPRERVWEIPQGVDTEIFRPATREIQARARERERLPSDAVVVVCVAGLVQRKGIDVLLDAWSVVIEEVKRVRLVLVGPLGEETERGPAGEFALRMLARIQSADFRESVVVAGFRSDIEKVLEAANIFVLPSRAEGLPNALLEAMAAGLPSVISDLPGVAGELLRDGVEGCVVAINDSAALATKLLWMIGHETGRKGMGDAARKRVEGRFAMETSAAAYVRLVGRLRAAID